uniref:RxLR effector protein n=1 Tax=Peronospora matthiolae TaxID=2874970 RepID=A0AAV1TCQ7_9STRA
MRSFYLFALAVSCVLLVLVDHASGLEGLEVRASGTDGAEDTNGLGPLTAAHDLENRGERALFLMENAIAMLKNASKWLKDKLNAFSTLFSRLRKPKNEGVTHVAGAKPKNEGVTHIAGAKPKNEGVTHVAGAKPKNEGVTHVAGAKPKNEGVTHVAGAIAHKQQNSVDPIAPRFQKFPRDRPPAVVLEPVEELHGKDFQHAMKSLRKILSSNDPAVVRYNNLLVNSGNNRGLVARHIYDMRMQDRTSAKLHALELAQFASWIVRGLKHKDVVNLVTEACDKYEDYIAKVVADRYVSMSSIAMDRHRSKLKL